MHRPGEPAAGGRPTAVLNKVTETHRIADLAKMVASITSVDIAHLPNPRREAEEENELEPMTIQPSMSSLIRIPGTRQ